MSMLRAGVVALVFLACAVAWAASPSDFGIVDSAAETKKEAPPAPAKTAPKKARQLRPTPRPPEPVHELGPEPASAAGQPRGLGLGVIFGEPTGLTGKVWTGSRSAIDLGTAYSFHSYFLVYADALWHFEVFPKRDEFTRHTTLYLGAGGGMYLGSNFRFNIRVPVGLEWAPGKPPLGVFAELVPAVRVIPNVTGDFGGGVGIRYYF